MICLIVHRLAEEVLRDLSKFDKSSFKRISRALDELQKKGLSASNCKAVTGGRKIYRKRTGRFRILFTVDNETFHIWIIDMKKSSRDYLRWILYIHAQQN